jgi:hypothetical protein
VVYLADYCNAHNIDLAEAVREHWLVVRERDWNGDPDHQHQVHAAVQGLRRAPLPEDTYKGTGGATSLAVPHHRIALDGLGSVEQPFQFVSTDAVPPNTFYVPPEPSLFQFARAKEAERGEAIECGPCSRAAGGHVGVFHLPPACREDGSLSVYESPNFEVRNRLGLAPVRYEVRDLQDVAGELLGEVVGTSWDEAVEAASKLSGLPTGRLILKKIDGGASSELPEEVEG